MVHKQVSESGIITWSSPTLSGIPGVRHRFFGRTGGVSEGSYASLNLNNAEDALTKARNMELVAGVMGVAAGDIRGVQQKHGSNIVTLTEANIHMDMYNLEADGIVTNMHGVYVSVVTADCCPVLLCDAENAVVAAAVLSRECCLMPLLKWWPLGAIRVALWRL
jgi:copper oxidase (laccase) domain-containing protein